MINLNGQELKSIRSDRPIFEIRRVANTNELLLMSQGEVLCTVQLSELLIGLGQIITDKEEE